MAALSHISVTGSGGSGGSQYIVAPLQATLQNPSNVSLNTVGILLPVTFNGVNIGLTAINVQIISLLSRNVMLIIVLGI